MFGRPTFGFSFFSFYLVHRCTSLHSTGTSRPWSRPVLRSPVPLYYTTLQSESPLPGFVGGRGQKGGGAVTRRQGGGSAGCGGVDFARSACGSGDGARMGTEIDSVILCLGSSALIAFMSASASRGSPSRARPSTKPS